MIDLLHKDLTYKINGILFTVHNELGRYRNEKQYCDAIEQKLKEAGINYEREKVLPPSFNGETKGRNRIDFLIAGVIILEIKAKDIIDKEDYYQTRRYLDTFGRKLAILVNFRNKTLRIKRVLNSNVQ